MNNYVVNCIWHYTKITNKKIPPTIKTPTFLGKIQIYIVNVSNSWIHFALYRKFHHPLNYHVP